MLRSGFGARTAKSLSSTSAGRQTISDRDAGADSVIRAITAGEAFRLGKALMFKSGLTRLLSGYA